MLSWMTDVNVSTRTVRKMKVDKYRKKKKFCWHLESNCQTEQDPDPDLKPDPDPSLNVTDPEHWLTLLTIG
jgi:hypothetical protein